MSRPDRRQAKQKARERSKKFDRRRKQESRQRDNLLIESDAAADRRDWAKVAECLARVLDVRPKHREARERLAHAYFLLDRPAEGLAHFDLLTDDEPPPGLIYLAALASWRLGDAPRGAELASQFLRASKHVPWFDQARVHARALRETCRKEARKARSASARRATAPPQPSPTPPAGPEAPRPTDVARVADQPALFDAADSVPRATDTATRAPGPVPSPPATPAPPAASVATAFPKPSVPDIDVSLTWDEAAVARLLGSRSGPLTDPSLRRAYAELRLQKGFDQLVALSRLHDVEHFWYQLATVRRVLRDFRGRALLADEVGLGKTIEACLALKEYWMRGLVRRALVLVPPSLVSQWVAELSSKFGLEASTPESDGYASDPGTFWSAHPLIVASMALARQPANRERLAGVDLDMVIVDEAHYLKNRSTASWQLVNGLKKRFLLLLSATPVGNDLGELYNLITLLRPGLLSTEARFRRTYGRVADLEDPARREKLRALLSEVMIRNTRAHIDLKLPRRFAATIRVAPDAAERAALDAVEDFILERYASAPHVRRFGLMTLQMQAGSSLEALRRGLAHHALDGDPALRALRARVGHDVPSPAGAKTRALLDLLARSSDKVIVFSRYLATIGALARALAEAGVRVAVFHGQLTAAQKDAAIAAFEDEAAVLLTSEIGGEGRNLQFCRTVVNFDLPWNPVAIEQRVGRVHRIGQTRDVYVFNLCLVGSVEERMLEVLHDKINLFELVAGEMEMILGRLDDDQGFAATIMDLWAAGTTSDARARGFAALGDRLSQAKDDYLKKQSLDRALFGEDYEA